MPVARLVPVGDAADSSPARRAALARTRARMAQGWPIGAAGIADRASMHER